FLAGIITLRQADVTQAPQSVVAPQRASKPTQVVKAPHKPIPALRASITAFSDKECGSKWCDRHEPKAGQVAVNYATIGKVCQLSSPAYDKTYRVVGNTDGRTDVDIWFGANYQAALTFGSKTLLVNPIPCP